MLYSLVMRPYIINMNSRTDSKGNVFRLSGNMALGAMPTANYSQEQINQARSSLQLLKSKQNKPSTEESGARVGSYGNMGWQPPTSTKPVLSNNPESMNRPVNPKKPTYEPMERPNMPPAPNLPRRTRPSQ